MELVLSECKLVSAIYFCFFKYIIRPVSHLVLTGVLLLCFSCGSDPDIEPVEQSCMAVAATGGLSKLSSDIPFSLKTAGGGEVEVRSNWDIVIRHKDYESFKIEFWGYIEDGGNKVIAASHENLNGKHLKDRIGNSRTLIFPDGAKMTLVAAGPYEPVTVVSFYDGAQSHRINMSCEGGPVLEHSSNDAVLSKALDDAEPDGEAGGFVFTDTGISFMYFYLENEPGVRVENEVILGKIFRDNPTHVEDNYDDPRLGHT